MKYLSIIPEQLESFEYYVNKLPQYLQESEGFTSHFRIWYDLLVGQLDGGEKLSNTGVVGSAQVLFNMLNIFEYIKTDDSIINVYLEDLITFEDADVSEQHRYGTKSDILDKLGALVGVQRSFELTYQSVVEGSVTTVTKYLTLDNEELLILIKARIIKNYCDGTYEQMKAYYESVGLRVLLKNEEPATVSAALGYASNSSYRVSDNVLSMFLAGMLTIEPMGIQFNRSYIDFDKLLVWDSETVFWGNGNNDGGQWVA